MIKVDNIYNVPKIFIQEVNDEKVANSVFADSM